MCPSSWKARIRWSGIARPMWMSGEVTSIPSLTRNGRPSFSLASSPPSGSTSTALRVRSEIATGARLAGVLALFRRKTRAPKRRRIRKLRLLGLLLVLFTLGFAAFTYGMLTAVASQIPSLDPTKPPRLQANTYVYAADGKTVLAILRGSQSRVVLPASEISPLLGQAIVAIEDKRFYEHHGVDVRAILRAGWNDLLGRPVQGGSTITQQFVKNAINGSAPTVGRKLKEAALAWRLEQKWTKDQILTAYLNTVYFGNGAYGVQQACKVYFGHSADTAHVTLAEAALLAGIPEDPTLWDPVAHPNSARARRNLVLRQMLDQNYISTKQYARAVKAPMPNPRTSAPLDAERRRALLRELRHRPAVRARGTRYVYGANLRVTTTIDLGLQKLAREAIAKEPPPSIGPTAVLVALATSHAWCWQWSAAATTTTASSTWQRRVSASRGRRSSRSCSPRRSSRESRPPRRSCLIKSRSSSATSSGTSTTSRASTSARSISTRQSPSRTTPSSRS